MKIFKTLALFLSLYASSALADPYALLEQFEQEGSTELGESSAQCVDFSGTWSGTCSMVYEDGDTQDFTIEKTLTVVQEKCSHIAFDGRDAKEIGSAGNFSYSSPRGFRFENGGSYWQGPSTLRIMFDKEGMLYGDEEPFKTVNKETTMVLADANTLTLEKKMRRSGADERSGERQSIAITLSCQLIR